MKNKEKILKIIYQNPCGISAKEILKLLGNSINKTTIYRNLNKLLKENLILEDFSNSGEKIYYRKDNHHHHFVCNRCGKIFDINCFLDSYILEIEKNFGFKITNHSLLLNGLCKYCRSIND